MKIENRNSQHSGRAMLIIIVILHIFVRSLISIVPSALMTVIMPDMGIGYSEVGMMAYIVTIMMGVFLFVGSYIISRLGAVRALAIAMASFCADGVISYITRDYMLVILGRALSGIGYGFAIVATSSLIAEWFDKRQYSVANSVSSVINSVSLTAAFGIVVPVYGFTGTWQREMLLWSALAAVCCLALLIWGRGKADKTKMPPGGDQRPAYSLLCAIRYKEVRYLMVAMAGSMWVSTSLTTYLPTYLTESYGLSLEHASFAAGIMSFAGIAGSLLAGFLYRIVQNKKVLLNIPMMAALCSAVCVALLPPGPLLYICVFGFGFCNMGWCTLSGTFLMNLEGVTPAVISGLMAVLLGPGSLLAFFAPLLFSAMRESAGIQTTLLLFSFFLIVSVVSMLLFSFNSVKPGTADIKTQASL
jgi:Cyanate permease